MDIAIRQLLQRKPKRDLVTVCANITLRTAGEMMVHSRVGSIIMVNNKGSVTGILTERDFMWRVIAQGGVALEHGIDSCMTTNVITCNPSDMVSVVEKTMTNRKFRHMPVVDDDDTLIGIVSLGDVVKFRIDTAETEAAALREYVQTA